MDQEFHLTAHSLYFSLCWHLFMISDLLLSNNFGSPLRISCFSLRQISHLRVPHWYGKDCLWRDHFISKGIFCSLSFQMYFERHVSDFLTGFENDVLWLAYLFFQMGSVAPMYRLITVRAVTSVWYTSAPFAHYPSRGQLSLCLGGQLQSLSFSTVAG